MTRVAVVVMSYNQGAFLDECLDSVLAQESVEIELALVDHASNDPWSRARAEQAAAARGVRHVALERQPTVARARTLAIAETDAELVLPLDADNLLLPGALRHLTETLTTAPADVGFVYPRLAYFNEQARWERPVPAYNLYALMLGNYCDTGGLWRRECFEDGIPEVPFHEDWALALALGERGVHGIPAPEPTLLLRSHGFTRSLRAGADDRRLRSIAESCPGLYEPTAFAAVKARWAPALSVVAEGERADLERLVAAQTCTDLELLVPDGDDSADRLATGSRAALGAVRLLAGPHAAELLGRRELVEQLLRVLARTPGTDALVLVAGERHYPLEPLADADLSHVCAVALRGDPRDLDAAEVDLDPTRPLPSLAAALLERAASRVQLRGVPILLPRSAAVSASPPSAVASQLPVSTSAVARRRVVLADAPPSPFTAEEQRFRMSTPPLLPGSPRGADVLDPPPIRDWAPRDAVALLRFVDLGSGTRRVGTAERPAPGVVDAQLGWLVHRPLPGTAPVRVTPDGLLARCTEADDPLGHIELEDLTGFDELLVVRDPTGRTCVASSSEDPVAAGATVVERLGWVEPVLAHPHQPRHYTPRAGRIQLSRVLGEHGHRYVLGDAEADAELVLGLLLTAAAPGTVPLYSLMPDTAVPLMRPDLAAPDGGPRSALSAVDTAAAPPYPQSLAGLAPAGSTPLPRAARAARTPRWLAAPLGWRGWRTWNARTDVVRWRARNSARLLGADPAPSAAPLAWAWERPAAGRVTLHAAWHPVSADLLLTLDPHEARNLGYGETETIGYLEALGGDRWGDLSRRRAWAFQAGELHPA